MVEAVVVGIAAETADAATETAETVGTLVAVVSVQRLLSNPPAMPDRARMPRHPCNAPHLPHSWFSPAGYGGPTGDPRQDARNSAPNEFPEPSAESLAQRPRLKLAPRTVKSEVGKPAPAAQSSIFGNAKPRDENAILKKHEEKQKAAAAEAAKKMGDLSMQ